MFGRGYRHEFICGIYYLKDGFPRNPRDPETKCWLPLLSLSAHASISHSSSRVTLKQSFSGPPEKSIDEAAYCFPLYENASVVAFTCKIGNRTIKGVVEEKNKARKTYEAAKSRGESAGLLVQNTPDVWSTKLGNIPAGSKVQVEIQYVCELKHDSQVDGVRFVLPTHIAPKYGDLPENLPASIDSNSKGVEIVVDVIMASPITSIQSPSHPIAVEMGSLTEDQTSQGKDFDVCKARAKLSQASTALDKDFVVMILANRINEPQAILETHSTIPNQRAIMVTLVPRFEIPRIKPEIVFIADRSGSMQDKVVQLRNALVVFLKSLPVGVKFNICSFGSNFTFLWPQSRSYDQDNLDIALKHVQTFEANYGGTEMFPPFEAAFKQRYKDLQTEILVLTDGEIWNTQPLFDMVRKECKSGDVRVFSLGIGDSVSHSLLEGLAKAGGGYAQIVGKEDKLDAKVVRMLRAALGVHIRDYQIQFQEDHITGDASIDSKSIEEDDDFEMLEHEDTSKSESKELPSEKKKTISLFDPSVDCDMVDQHETEDRFAHLLPFTPPSKLQTPFTIPPLYPFTRSTVYIFLSSAEKSPKTLTLRGSTTSGETLELEIPVMDIGEGSTLHQLAARKLMRELEDGDSYLHSGKFGIDPVKDEGKFLDWIQREGVRVGTTYGVAGKWTSFVAVENGEGREQPIPQEDDEVVEASVRGASWCSLSKPVPRMCKSAAGPRALSRNNLKVSSPAQQFGGTTQAAFGAPGARSFSAHAPAFGTMSRASDVIPVGRAGPPAFASSAFGIQTNGVPTAQMGDGMSMPQFGMFQSGDTMSEPPVPTVSGFRFAHDSTPSTEVPEGEKEEDKTYRLMKQQAFDGSFSSNSGDWKQQMVLAYTQFVQQEQDLVTIQALTSQEIEKLLCTALAISMFETDLKNMKDVWSLVVEKADEWGAGVAGDKVWTMVKMWASEHLASADEKAKQALF